MSARSEAVDWELDDERPASEAVDHARRPGPRYREVLGEGCWRRSCCWTRRREVAPRRRSKPPWRVYKGDPRLPTPASGIVWDGRCIAASRSSWLMSPPTPLVRVSTSRRSRMACAPAGPRRSRAPTDACSGRSRSITGHPEFLCPTARAIDIVKRTAAVVIRTQARRRRERERLEALRRDFRVVKRATQPPQLDPGLGGDHAPERAVQTRAGGWHPPATQQLGRLITDLLDSNQIEGGRLQLGATGRT